MEAEEKDVNAANEENAIGKAEKAAEEFREFAKAKRHPGKEGKAKRRLYRKLVRAYRRKLRKDSRESSPWDYRYGLEPFVDFLRFMKGYYELGWNVDCEDVDRPSRLDTVSNALAEYDAYEGCDRKYVDFDESETHLSEWMESTKGSKETVFIPSEKDGRKGYRAVVTSGVRYLLGDPKATYKALNEEKDLHWKTFWGIVRDNMLGWWD